MGYCDEIPTVQSTTLQHTHADTSSAAKCNIRSFRSNSMGSDGPSICSDEAKPILFPEIGTFGA